MFDGHDRIDWHAHILAGENEQPPGAVDWPTVRPSTSGRSSHQIWVGGRLYRDIDSRATDPARRLEDMDRDGVSCQVLSAPPLLQAYVGATNDLAALATQHNAFLADVVAKGHGRFAMMGMLPLSDPEATAQEIARLEQYPGMVGISLPAYMYDDVIHDTETTVWSAMAALGWLVFVHPADTALCDADRATGAIFGTAMPLTTARTATHFITSGLLDRVPDLTILLAHAGGAFPAIVDRMNHGWQKLGRNANLQESPLTHVRRSFWADSVVYGARNLRHAQEIFGAERLVYGSDYPFDATVTAREITAMGADPAGEAWLDSLDRNGAALLERTSSERPGNGSTL